MDICVNLWVWRDDTKGRTLKITQKMYQRLHFQLFYLTLKMTFAVWTWRSANSTHTTACPYWDCSSQYPMLIFLSLSAFTHTHMLCSPSGRAMNCLILWLNLVLCDLCPCALWNAQVFQSSPFAPRICLAERREKDRPAGPICPFT